MEHLTQIIRTLTKKALLLVAVPVVTMIAIVLLTTNLPRKYRTDARIYLNLQEGKGVSLSDEDLKQYQVHTYFQNILELLKSKKVIERVRLKVVHAAMNDSTIFSVGNEELLANKALIEERVEELSSTHQLPGSRHRADQIMERYLHRHSLSAASMKESILAFRILDSNFMKFELTSDHPEKVQLLASFFIEALMEENTSLAKSKIKGHKDIIEELVRQAKADLDAKIKRLEKFKVDNTIINLGEHTKAIVVYLVQLEGTRANLLAKMAEGNKGRTEVLSAVQNGNEITLDLSGHSEILDLKNELKNMYRSTMISSLDKQQQPDMEAIQSEIDKKKQQIHLKLTELSRRMPYDPSQVQLDLVNRYLNYDLDAETSGDMVAIVNNEIQRVMSYSRRFAPFESTIGAYEQDISTAQNVYITLLNKLNLTETMEYGSGENVLDVVDPPFYPESPEPSKRMLLVAMGGISVFVLMVGFFVIAQLLDRTIQSAEAFERISPLPILAVVPEVPGTNPSVAETSVQRVEESEIHRVVNQVSTSRGVFLLASNQADEGTRDFAKLLQTHLRTSGRTVAVADVDWTQTTSEPSFETLTELTKDQGLIRNFAALQKRIETLATEHDIVLVVTPPQQLTAEVTTWLSKYKRVLLLIRAHRVYTKADVRLEATLRNLATSVDVVLFRMSIDSMEDYLGDIPRKRSLVRKIIKRILSGKLK